MNLLARPFVILVEKFFPESFVFAIALSVIVFLACLGFTDATPVETLFAWGDGLQGLLAFMAQIALTVLLAHSLAHTGPVRRGLSVLGRLPNKPWQAYALVTLIAGLSSLFAWAFGLIVGALLARQVAIEARARGMKVHYPLLVASAYAGFVVWHMGYSGSAPLFVATPGNAMEETIGRLIPVTETIFAPWNILTAIITLAVIVVLMPLMRPRADKEEVVEMSQEAIDDYVQQQRTMDLELAENLGRDEASTAENRLPTPAQRLDGTRVLVLVPGLALLVYLVLYFAQNGLSLTLDIVNWTFLCLGLLFSRSILHYVKLIANASTSVGQLLVQYPFYAGIMGMMAGTGFITVVSDWFTSISTASTLGFWAFLSAGILNMFVPSGGGQWAIQGPIFLEAAQTLGAQESHVVMGVAYGDQWTNMAQPFFAVPLLAVAGIHVRKIMGYTIMVLIATFFTLGGGILFAGFFM